MTEVPIDQTQTTGLICAFILDGKGGGTPLDWAGVRAWKPQDGLLWVHLERKAPVTRDWLLDDSGISRVMAESLLADDARPRVVNENDTLMVVLRGMNLNPGANPEDMISVRAWFDAHRIITLRHARIMAVNDLREAIARGAGPANAGEFLARLCDRLIERAGPVIDDIDERLDGIEENVTLASSADHRGALLRVRQAAIGIRRYLSPQRDAMSRLLAEHIEWIGDLDMVLLREVADRTTRYVEDLEAARERASVIQEELNYQVSDRINRTMYLLTVVAAIMLPPSLLAGVLGINVGGMPGAEEPLAFWVVVAIIGGLGVIEFALLRWLKWI